MKWCCLEKGDLRLQLLMRILTELFGTLLHLNVLFDQSKTVLLYPNYSPTMQATNRLDNTFYLIN